MCRGTTNEDEIERANPEREGGTEDEEGTKAVPLPIQSLRDDEASEGKEKATKNRGADGRHSVKFFRR